MALLNVVVSYARAPINICNIFELPPSKNQRGRNGQSTLDQARPRLSGLHSCERTPDSGERLSPKDARRKETTPTTACRACPAAPQSEGTLAPGCPRGASI